MTKIDIFGQEFELDKRHSFEIGEEVITAGGIKYFRDTFGVNLPPDFDLHWMSKGGAFSKRLAKHFKKINLEYNETKFSAFCATLKNRYCTKPQVYWFDITRDFTWRSGDFADRGSCYWNSGPDRGYRGSLTKLKGLAFRLYESETGKGTGRCWLIPVRYDEDGRIHAVAAYNAYGPELAPMMNIMSTFFKVQTKFVYIRLGDGGGSELNGGLYINNSGESIVVGPKEHLDTISERENLILYHSLYQYRCCKCYAGLPKKEVVYNEKTYCKRCFGDRVACMECNNLFTRKEVVNLRDSKTKERTRTICKGCNNERKKASKETQEKELEGEQEDV